MECWIVFNDNFFTLEFLSHCFMICFRDIVKASHLTPMGKKENIADLSSKNVIWNTAANPSKEEKISSLRNQGKAKHFTEK